MQRSYRDDWNAIRNPNPQPQSWVAIAVVLGCLAVLSFAIYKSGGEKPAAEKTGSPLTGAALTGAASLPAPPPCLCQDDGKTPLPGIHPRTDWAAICCYVAQDMGHAEIGTTDPQKTPTWELIAVAGGTNSRPSISWIKKPNPGYPVTLDPPLTLPGYSGLVLGKCSTAAAAGKVVQQEKLVAAAARRPIAPCLSFVPLTAKEQANGWTLPPEAFISAGDSYSIQGWVIPAVVCHLGFRAETLQSLQAAGELCKTIKTITVEEVCRAIGKQPRADGLLPYFRGTELSFDQSELMFKTIARRANAISTQPAPSPNPNPDPSPRTDFDLLWEVKIAPTGFTDREFAEKYWKLGKALK